MVSAQVGLRRSGRSSYPVRTADVTRFGCKCEFVERPEIGERMWIKFDGLDAIEARTCWLGGSDVGLKFEHPIHPAVFDLLLLRLQR
jgi:hypothetical protein